MDYRLEQFQIRAFVQRQKLGPRCNRHTWQKLVGVVLPLELKFSFRFHNRNSFTPHTCSTMAFRSIFWNFLNSTKPAITSDGTTSKSLKKSERRRAISAKEFLFLSEPCMQQKRNLHRWCQLSWYALKTFLQHQVILNHHTFRKVTKFTFVSNFWCYLNVCTEISIRIPASISGTFSSLPKTCLRYRKCTRPWSELKLVCTSCTRLNLKHHSVVSIVTTWLFEEK